MDSVPAYAPTSTTSYTPSQGLQYHAAITRSSIIKSNTHKLVYDSLAEIYSIITTLEVIENSFLKDYITDKEKYTSTCLRLIRQYQMLVKGFDGDDLKREILKELFQDLAPDNSNLVDLIATKFNLEAPNALNRLKTGVPATIEHFHTHVGSHAQEAASLTSSLNAGSAKASARLVAESTGNFITCMDALKLNYNTKEQLHPLLSNLVVSLNDLVTKMDGDEDNLKPIEFHGKSKLVSWLIKLNNLQPDDQLSQEDSDTFLQDLDSAYKGFYNSLE